MSTHATIVIKDHNRTLVSFYQHSDGYLESLGKDIAHFLDGMVVVNGITNTTKKTANGMGCLAAQLCSYLKHEVGGLYIIPECHRVEDYSYIIGYNFISVRDMEDELLFYGTWEEYVNKYK